VHWMSRRSRPHYRPGLEWILGVAFPYTLTRPVRLAQGLPFVRCCGSSRASSPHGLTAPGPASHDGDDCVQLPLARGCYHLAPRRTFTSNPVPMPGTHVALAARRGDCRNPKKSGFAAGPVDARRRGVLMDAVAALPPGRRLIVAACAALGLSRASFHRRTATARRPPAPVRPRPRPARALAVSERQAVLDLLREPRFVDQPPA